MKKWIVKKPAPEVIRALTSEGITSIAAEISAANGIKDIETAKEFFGSEKLSDPFSIIDMEAAVNAINDIVFENGDRVCIYGDYDCDGVCASVLLYTFFEASGADVTYRINSREEGFGLNSDVIRELAEDGVKLIITVDNGISAVDEAALINSLGMNLIITDHHEPSRTSPEEKDTEEKDTEETSSEEKDPEEQGTKETSPEEQDTEGTDSEKTSPRDTLPEALAVVDPHREDNESEFRDYCGCGVALMLVAALMGDTEAALEQFSDIAALATVADMVPLTGENRVIVNHGLHYIEHTENLGLKALVKVSGITQTVNSSHLGFYLGPRINAAGRIGHANTAFELLTCEDPERAKLIAEELSAFNVKRKEVEAELLAAVKKTLSDDPRPLYNRILVLYIKNANHGVIGLAAGRILDAAGKPVFLMTDDEGGMLRGSVRSLPGFSVVEALGETSEFLTKFGGHALAGGFSLKSENFEKFAAAVEEYAKRCGYNGENSVTAVKILTAADLTVENAKEITALEPFGQGFSRPLFIIGSAVITNLAFFEKYVKVTIKLEEKNFSFNSFKIKPEKFTFVVGDKVDILTYFGIRQWNGGEYLNFDVEEIRLSGISQVKIIGGIKAYEAWKRGEYPERESLLRAAPSREDFAAVYRQLKALGKTIFSQTLIERNSGRVNSFKLMLILDIFEEAGLIKFNLFDGSITLIKNPEKASLEDTKTMKLISQNLHMG
jgi:single-stranded-DNA-specific exonuclease